jgi:hypothetical protein
MTERHITPHLEEIVPMGGRLVRFVRGATGALYEVIEEHDVIGIDVLRGTGCGCTVHGDRPTGLLRFPMTEEGPSAA